MEKWKIKNRTSGAVEIGCVRRTALQPGESYTFEGSAPEVLRWLVGAKKIFLVQVDTEQPKELKKDLPQALPERKKLRLDKTHSSETQD